MEGEQTDKVGVSPKKVLVWVAIVSGVIIILVLLLVPSYQGYFSRRQISEAVSLLLSAKTPVAEYYADKGVWPRTLDQVVKNTSGHYTDRIAITAGAGAKSGTFTLTATMKIEGSSLHSELGGKTLEISTDDGKTWICRSGATNGIDERHLPAACQ